MDNLQPVQVSDTRPVGIYRRSKLIANMTSERFEALKDTMLLMEQGSDQLTRRFEVLHQIVKPAGRGSNHVKFYRRGQYGGLTLVRMFSYKHLVRALTEAMKWADKGGTAQIITDGPDGVFKQTFGEPE